MKINADISHPKLGTYGSDRIRQFICELVDGKVGDRIAAHLKDPESDSERLKFASELLQLLRNAVREGDCSTFN